MRPTSQVQRQVKASSLLLWRRGRGAVDELGGRIAVVSDRPATAARKYAANPDATTAFAESTGLFMQAVGGEDESLGAGWVPSETGRNCDGNQIQRGTMGLGPENR